MERVQKSALRVILGNRYTSYSDALNVLNMKSLEDRRQSLCLKFAKKCLEVKKLKKMFPKKLTMHDMSKRNFEHYKVNRTLTKRYLNSAVPQMQRMLNSDKRKKIEILSKISSYPVNNDFCKSISLEHLRGSRHTIKCRDYLVVY